MTPAPDDPIPDDGSRQLEHLRLWALVAAERAAIERIRDLPLGPLPARYRRLDPCQHPLQWLARGVRRALVIQRDRIQRHFAKRLAGGQRIGLEGGDKYGRGDGHPLDGGNLPADPRVDQGLGDQLAVEGGEPGGDVLEPALQRPRVFKFVHRIGSPGLGVRQPAEPESPATLRPGAIPGGAAGDDGFDEILTALDLLSARAEALEARREATLGALLDRPDLLFKLFHIRAEGLAAAGAGQQRLTFELSELGLGLLAALRAGEVELGRVEIHLGHLLGSSEDPGAVGAAPGVRGPPGSGGHAEGPESSAASSSAAEDDGQSYQAQRAAFHAPAAYAPTPGGYCP